MKFILSLLFIWSFSLNAVEPIKPPLRGQGEYKWMFLSIYEAKLLADRGSDLYTKPLVLELKYQRDFKGKDIVDQSIKELLSAGHEKTQMEEWRSKLLEIFPDVKEGDTIEAHFAPEKGILFRLNSAKELGRIADFGFSKKFLDIWLGERTSAPELRKKLLGNNP